MCLKGVCALAGLAVASGVVSGSEGRAEGGTRSLWWSCVRNRAVWVTLRGCAHAHLRQFLSHRARAGKRTAMTTGTSASKRMLAAWGSSNMLNSATGDRFPRPSAPPMMTTWEILSRTRSGNIETNSAAFVIEPVATSVSRSPSGSERAASAMARTAGLPLVSSSLATTAGSSAAGSPSTPPRPSSPWISMCRLVCQR